MGFDPASKNITSQSHKLTACTCKWQEKEGAFIPLPLAEGSGTSVGLC